MTKRIESINRVKPIDMNISRPFGSADTGDRETRQSFQQHLARAMEKKSNEAVRVVHISDPYALEIGRATQSLFYSGGADLSGLGSLING